MEKVPNTKINWHKTKRGETAPRPLSEIGHARFSFIGVVARVSGRKVVSQPLHLVHFKHQCYLYMGSDRIGQEKRIRTPLGAKRWATNELRKHYANMRAPAPDNDKMRRPPIQGVDKETGQPYRDKTSQSLHDALGYDKPSPTLYSSAKEEAPAPVKFPEPFEHMTLSVLGPSRSVRSFMCLLTGHAIVQLPPSVRIAVATCTHSDGGYLNKNETDPEHGE